MNVSTRFAILGDVAKETAKNVAMMFPLTRKWRSRYRPTAILRRDMTEAELVEYGFSAFEMLLKHVPSPSIQGATVVEIGPGDNVVTGIPLFAFGAAAYHAIDPLMGNVDSETAHRLYARVAEELPKRWGIAREAVTDPACYPRALVGSRVFLYRKGIEEYRSFNLAGVADLVFSRGVGQSVALPESFAQASYDFLKPGGGGDSPDTIWADGVLVPLSQSTYFPDRERGAMEDDGIASRGVKPCSVRGVWLTFCELGIRCNDARSRQNQS